MILNVHRTSSPLHGTITVPGDKSISHRALLFGGLAEGTTQVRGFLASEDCQATMAAIRALGATVTEHDAQHLTISSPGYRALREPEDLIDCGNSGTTIRLLLGLLAGQPFATTLTGDATLRRRPMARVAEPLQTMGARILGRRDGTLAPLTIRGGGLRPIQYALPVASAQVKSALILAALQADGVSTITEPLPSRDHTELMLPAFGGHLGREGLTYTVTGGQALRGTTVSVPGDLSSAAFPLAAALLVADSQIQITNVGINPTRIGLLTTLQEMGADIRIQPTQTGPGEPVATLTVRQAPLRGVTIPPERVPLLIDELPILAVIATQAHGETVLTGAAELRVKESDRISRLVELLRPFGADITERPDGWVVKGPTPLHAAHVRSWGDHRLAMSAAVAGLIARGRTTRIDDAEAIQVSFPGFAACLASLGADLREARH